MTVEFELTKDDVKTYNLYHQRHSPAARRQFMRAWLGIPLAALFILILASFAASNRHASSELARFPFWPLLIFIPVFLFLFPWSYRRKVGKLIDKMISEGKNAGLLGQRRITLSPETISHLGELNQNITSWRAVERIAVDATHAYIYTSSLTAIILPRRAFPNPADFEAFLRTAKEYQAKANA